MMPTERLLVVAALLALVALGVMTTSVLVPQALSLVVAMSIGQAIGTASLALYLLAVWRTSRRPPDQRSP